MHTYILRLVIAVVLTLTGLVLLGTVMAVVDLSDHETGQARLTENKAWVTSGQEGSVQAISYPASGVSARRIITDPGINSPLVLKQFGREVLVTGHFSCTRGDDYEIQTAVTQSSTGALARGRTQGRCSGQMEQFEAATWVYDEALFKAGTAQACAMIVTRAGSKVTDVFQWCRKDDVNLVTTSSSN